MEYLLKSSVVVIVFYSCYQLLLKKETFFNSNRWFLLAGLILAIIFPFVVIPIHIPIEPLAVSDIAFYPSTSSNFVVIQPEATFDWTQLISIVYGTGFIVFLLQFLLQFGSLAILISQNHKHKEEQFTFVILKTKLSPFSFFNWIFYNPDIFEDKELKLILTHEKVHAKQFHSVDILLIHFACILFWFNPFIWFYKKTLRQNLEYIADYETQKESRIQKDYQHLLLKTSLDYHSISLSNHFYNSLIKERIVMLKKSRSDKKQQWKYVLIIPLLGGLLMSMNTKEVYVQSKKEIEKSRSLTRVNTFSKSQPIEIVFTNSMTDTQLDEIKNELKSQGVKMTINSLKRNSKGEIKAIDIDFETKNGSTNYNVKSNKGIDPFYFNMSEDGSFGVGAYKETEIIIATPLKSNSGDKPERTFIFSKDDGRLTEVINDTIAITTNGKTTLKRFFNRDSANVYTTYRANFENDSLYLFKGTIIDSIVTEELSNLKTDFFYQNEKPVEIISQSSTIYSPSITKQTIYKSYNDKTKPLVVLDGKILDNTILRTTNPEHIESLTVLKGQEAIDSYGEKGKNGIIEIKTKDPKNLKNPESRTSKKNPWSIRTEISNVTFIDEEDSSKNGMLAYITKYTPDQVLEKHKVDLEKFDLKVKFSKVKRNKNGEIISIKISVRNEEGAESSATWKNDDGIPSIEFGKSEGTLVARTSTMN
jgi:hypothetical protein